MRTRLEPEGEEMPEDIDGTRDVVPRAVNVRWHFRIPNGSRLIQKGGAVREISWSVKKAAEGVATTRMSNGL